MFGQHSVGYCYVQCDIQETIVSTWLLKSRFIVRYSRQTFYNEKIQHFHLMKFIHIFCYFSEIKPQLSFTSNESNILQSHVSLMNISSKCSKLYQLTFHKTFYWLSKKLILRYSLWTEYPMLIFTNVKMGFYQTSSWTTDR